MCHQLQHVGHGRKLIWLQGLPVLLLIALASNTSGCFKRKSKVSPKTSIGSGASAGDPQDDGVDGGVTSGSIIGQVQESIDPGASHVLSLPSANVIFPANAFMSAVTADLTVISLSKISLSGLSQELDVAGHCGRLVIRNSDGEILNRAEVLYPPKVQLRVPADVPEEELLFLVTRNPDVDGETTFGLPLGAMVRVEVDGVDFGQYALLESNARFCFVRSSDPDDVLQALETFLTLSVEVSGLGAGKTVVLGNGSSSLTFTQNGTQTFAEAYEAERDYQVEVTTAPAGQSCSVFAPEGQFSINP